MLVCRSIVVKDSPDVLNMMEQSLAIYDQALYFQRQAFFYGRDNNVKYQVYSYNELWSLTKDTEVYKSSKLDIGPKTYAIRQAVKNWKAYMKTNKDYAIHPEKYKAKPAIPRYLHRRQKYNIVQIDSSRFRFKNCKKNEICFPNIKYHFQIPLDIKIESVHQLNVQKYYNKTKVNIVYEDLKYIDNKVDEGSAMGVDLGVNNLCAITINDKPASYVIKGGPLKSMNQYYNKKKAKFQSILNICNNEQRYSRRLKELDMKRKHKVDNYMHKTANAVIQLALKHRVQTIVIGHNNDWKQKTDLGTKTNQNFVCVPFNNLINILQYKVERYLNLNLIVTEESYTSKCDHLIKESMEHHDKYEGKRTKRGQFKSSTGKIVNADINGAIGMLRKAKVITDVQILDLRDRGDIVSPLVLKLNP